MALIENIACVRLMGAGQFFADFEPYAVAAANSQIRPEPQFGLAWKYQPPRVITFQMHVMF